MLCIYTMLDEGCLAVGQWLSTAGMTHDVNQTLLTEASRL